MATLAPSPEIRQDRQTSGLYERDFYSWGLQQADALRRHDFAAVDLENVIEEIEDLAKAQRRTWEVYCARNIEHLLKINYWDRSTEWVLRHWAQEIRDFRKQMSKLIEKNPGLKDACDEMFAEAWEDGRDYAVDRPAGYDERRKVEGKEPVSFKKERRKWDSILPRQCPYRFEHVTAFDAKTDRRPREDVWPPAVARIFNARLDEDYPLLPDYEPDPGRSRGIAWDR